MSLEHFLLDIVLLLKYLKMLLVLLNDFIQNRVWNLELGLPHFYFLVVELFDSFKFLLCSEHLSFFDEFDFAMATWLPPLLKF